LKSLGEGVAPDSVAEEVNRTKCEWLSGTMGPWSGAVGPINVSAGVDLGSSPSPLA